MFFFKLICVFKKSNAEISLNTQLPNFVDIVWLFM